jgi:hypothetical protein
MSQLETPISQLLQESNPSSGFEQGPDPNIQDQQYQQQQEQEQQQEQYSASIQELQHPMQGLPSPSPSGQGQSPSSFFSGQKEMFGAQKEDFLSILIVFCIILVVASGALNNQLKASPMFADPTGKLTLSGIVVTAIAGSIFYILVKIMLKVLA